MQEQQDQPPKLEYATRLVLSVLDEGSGLLKLRFTLSTGAVVLFINVIAASHARRLVLAPLMLSIFAFAVEALLCVRVLWTLVGLRMVLADGILNREPEEQIKRKLEDWQATSQKTAKRMDVLFRVGMIFAAVFVLGIFMLRP